METQDITNEEYLHLAMEAIQRSDHGGALSYLKKGSDLFPADGRLAYLLGAEHAQIGLYDEAESEMSRAVALDPSLYMACFQLGLLQMTRAKTEQARASWQGLDALPEGHALRLFRDGVLALAMDQFDDARNYLRAGLAANDFSQDLNRDMEGLLGKVPEAMAESPAATEHVWLNAYRSNEEPH